MHDIEIADGKASFVSGEGMAAWHGLGTVVEGTMTAAEALGLANLNWEVALRPSLFEDENGNLHEVPNRFAVVRSSDQKPFEVVSGTYVPVQNVEAFSFFDSVVDRTGEAHYSTAGALGGGKHVFLSAKIGETFTVAGQDAHDLYIMITNSHDAKHSFTAIVTPIRVVCRNTMTFALDTARHRMSLRHTESIKGKVQQAREVLDMAYKYQEEFEHEVEALSSISMNTDKFTEVISGLFPEDKKTTNRYIDDLVGIWIHETTVNDAFGNGTGWGALNSVTYWTDHVKASRTAEARFKSVIGGSAEKFRNDVRDRVLALA
jgi:phage/plasmid-like protein (TIGR03299 family)